MIEIVVDMDYSLIQRLAADLPGVKLMSTGLEYKGAWIGFPDQASLLPFPMELLDGVTSQGVPVLEAVRLIELYHRCFEQPEALARLLMVLEASLSENVAGNSLEDGLDRLSTVSGGSCDSQTSARSLRKNDRRLAYFQRVADEIDRDGYCYLRMIRSEHRGSIMKKLGAEPNLLTLLSLPSYVYCLDAWSNLKMVSEARGYHVEPGQHGLTSSVLATLLEAELNPSLVFRIRLESPGSDLGQVLDLSRKCGVRTPLSPVSEIHGVERVFDSGASAQDLDGAMLLSTEYDDIPTVRTEVLLEDFCVVPGLQEKLVEVSDTVAITLIAGSKYRLEPVGVGSVVIAHFPAGSKIIVRDKIYANVRDTFVRVIFGYTLQFSVSGVGKNVVVAHHFSNRMIELTDKQRLWSKFHSIFHSLYWRKHMPLDVSILAGVISDSKVSRSLKTGTFDSISKSAVILVKERVAVSMVSRLFPKNRVRWLPQSEGQQYDQVVLLLLPVHVSGNYAWTKDISDIDKLKVAASEGSYLAWSSSDIMTAITRHVFELQVVNMQYDRDFDVAVSRVGCVFDDDDDE